MRDLKEVMKRVLALVPDDDDRKGALSATINRITDSIYYTAPELMSLRWQEFCDAMQDLFPDVDTPWLKQIQSLIAGRE